MAQTQLEAKEETLPQIASGLLALHTFAYGHLVPALSHLATVVVGGHLQSGTV